MSYSLSDNKMSMSNFPGLHDNCGANSHMMPDGSCMEGKQHPGPAKAVATSKATTVKEKMPAKEPKTKKLTLGKAK